MAVETTKGAADLSRPAEAIPGAGIATPESCLALASQLIHSGRLSEALPLAEWARTLSPRLIEAVELIALIHERQGAYSEAIVALEEALLLDPTRWNTREALASLHSRVGADDLALLCLEQGLALDPAPRGYKRLGLLQLQRKDFAAAEESLLAAANGGLSDPQLHYNLGWLAKEAGRYALAEREFERTLRLDPHHARAEYNLAQACLAEKEDERGFRLYEARWRCPDNPEPMTPWPRWDGRHDPELHLIVTLEQGLGDALFFARWLPLARLRVGRLSVFAKERVGALLARLEGVDGIIADADPMAYVATIPIGSLPSTLGHKERALAPPAPRLRGQSAASGALREWLADTPSVGIAIHWQGNPDYPGDAQRSIPIEQFAALARRSRHPLFSVQAGKAAADLERVDFTVLEPPLPGDRRMAFADTEVLLRRAEALVTSDTAIAHFAGLLRVPTHLILNRPAEWRWGVLGTRCDWYETITVHRQPRPGDWEGAFASVLSALASSGVAPLDVS